MLNNQIVIIPPTSGIQVKVEFPILSKRENLVTNYRESLKLSERPLDVNSLFNSKLLPF